MVGQGSEKLYGHKILTTTKPTSASTLAGRVLAGFGFLLQEILMVTQLKALIQADVTQTYSSIINPSRQITADDELYLRDYMLAAAVISWDRGTYNTPERLTSAQITNIALTGDTVWYQIDFHQAIPIDIETFHAHRLQVQSHTEVESKPEQPAGFAGDSTSCQLRPKPEFITQYEQGKAHGMLDAHQGIQAICIDAECPYSAGYVEGYASFTGANEKIAAPTAPTWSVTYDDKWQFYRVWVGDRAIGTAATSEQAEAIAQKYIATGQLWQEHRERVLASYAN